MSTEILNRLASLRKAMKKNNIAAAIVPQADPHISEYLSSHWQLRRWLSGFSGSAGDLVITADKAALWTDSRYFLQASMQLEGSGIELMKDGLADTPSIESWLVAELKSGDVVGVDGMLMPYPKLEALKAAMAAHGIAVDPTFDPAQVWKDRPEMPDGEVVLHELKYAGESAESKIERELEAAKAAGADAIFLSALDDIAWTLNIRSTDVKYTPVASSFLYLSDTLKVLFINPKKVNKKVGEALKAIGLTLADYTAAPRFLGNLKDSVKVLVETGRTSGAVMDILGGRAVKVALSPAAEFKCIKNAVQINGIRNAMVRDGVALVHVFKEIEDRLAKGVTTTEMDVAELLREYRGRGENYRDESFGTIAGYGPHGAIVHYEADEESNATLRRDGLLLIDSGAQYVDGTTDITRTIALGEPTEQEKADFTLVMKGHIALGTLQFPDDTVGAQIDAVARQYLWRAGLSYLHGTGHGVGHYLGVHEGPQSIRLNYVPVKLRPGMVISNEPGLYRANIHGIRCENLVLCRHAISNEFGTFLCFETLTLMPFDRKLFNTKMMTAEEIAWVDGYHARVKALLTPYLDKEHAKWLAEKTMPLATPEFPF